MKDVTTYDVKVFSVRAYKGARRTTYTVRWRVAGKDFQQTFNTAKLAESYRAEIHRATTTGTGFNTLTGLPATMQTPDRTTWLEHATDFVRMKWPEAAPKYRQSLAGSLTVVTLALHDGDPLPASEKDVRAVLRDLFSLQEQASGSEGERIRAWLHRKSPPLVALNDRVEIRRILDQLAVTYAGEVASQATITRRRSALHNCLEYAVELDRLASNPLLAIRRKRQPPQPAIDRRRVANPTQARALIAAMEDVKPELKAFVALMYYAGMRPGEVLNIRTDDLELPSAGWGRVILASSYQALGKDWTGSGRSGEERQLKHRAKGDTRPIPAHPELVTVLRQHTKQFPQGGDGRLFVARTGQHGVPLSPPYNTPISLSTVYRAWSKARAQALTPAEARSPLAQRPYDLRHACLSTWLNAGVPPVQVAEWAGHSVAVLLSVYAKCIDGGEVTALARIEGALGATHGRSRSVVTLPVPGRAQPPRQRRPGRSSGAVSEGQARSL